MQLPMSMYGTQCVQLQLWLYYLSEKLFPLGRGEHNSKTGTVGHSMLARPASFLRPFILIGPNSSIRTCLPWV